MKGLLINYFAAQNLLNGPLANQHGRLKGGVVVAGGEVLGGFCRGGGLRLLDGPLAGRNLRRVALAEGELLTAGLLGGGLRRGRLGLRRLCQGSTGGAGRAC